MADMTLTAEDREVIRQILTAERERGNQNPLLPADVDLDGDGIADSFGLDDAGEVILVPGVQLTDTLYVAEGENVPPVDEAGGQ